MQGILFKPPMIQAIVAGRKTQTRLAIKPQPILMDKVYEKDFRKDAGGREPRYHTGETVYIKEAHYAYGKWKTNGFTEAGRPKWDFHQCEEFGVWFEDNKPPGLIIEHGHTDLGWYKRSALFLAEKFARYFIKITDVIACRTRDISFEDCLAEGVVDCPFWGKNGEPDTLFQKWYDGEGHKVPIDDYIDAGWIAYARSVYFALYDSINGHHSHGSNWDWKFSFVKVKSPK